MILSRIILFVFIFSAIFLFREAYLFVSALFDDKKAEEYKPSPVRKIGVGAALSFIMSTLIIGF